MCFIVPIDRICHNVYNTLVSQAKIREITLGYVIDDYYFGMKILEDFRKQLIPSTQTQ